jgi:methylglyoxal synthase
LQLNYYKAEKAGFKVTKMLSGPMGGDAQIAARVAEEKTKMVLQRSASHAHEVDINMLLRVCDVQCANSHKRSNCSLLKSL